MSLIEAVIANDSELVKLLLSQGANPNECEDVAGVTPLHFAVQNNSIEVALLLINAGANMHAITDDGMSILDVAEVMRNDKMAGFLCGLY